MGDIEYDGTVQGVSSRPSVYYRYLLPDGKLTPFQQQKLQERRSKRLVREKFPLYTTQVQLSVADEMLLTMMMADVKVNAKGFFVGSDVVERYSLRMLYRCRCRQLNVPINHCIDQQLPPAASLEFCLNMISLDVSPSYVGPLGVFALASVLPFCTELRSLVLSGVGIKATPGDGVHFTALMAALEHCPYLKHLDLSNNAIDSYFGSVLIVAVQSHSDLTAVNLQKSGLCDLVVKKVRSVVEQRNLERVQNIREVDC